MVSSRSGHDDEKDPESADGLEVPAEVLGRMLSAAEYSRDAHGAGDADHCHEGQIHSDHRARS